MTAGVMPWPHRPGLFLRKVDILKQAVWRSSQGLFEVKLVAPPDSRTSEQFILCRSSARPQKEAAMLELQRQRLLAKLQQLNRSLAKHPRGDADAVKRRLGRKGSAVALVIPG
jgi:hypothetical protein